MDDELSSHTLDAQRGRRIPLIPIVASSMFTVTPFIDIDVYLVLIVIPLLLLSFHYFHCDFIDVQCHPTVF